jgi:hypothetical protein
VRRRRNRAGPLDFDPDLIGRWECDAWVAYYRRDWLRFLTGAVRMVDAGFGMSRHRTLVGAWHVLRANQVWAPYPDNDPDDARKHMRRFYALVARSGHPSLDPVRAAELEVEWWRVHRLHQRVGSVSDADLVNALGALYSFVYGLPAAAVVSAAEFRTKAMDCSDDWVAAGTDLADPRLHEERRLLIASYRALREAIDGSTPDGAMTDGPSTRGVQADGPASDSPTRAATASDTTEAGGSTAPVTAEGHPNGRARPTNQASTGRPPRDIAASGGTTPAGGTGSGVA